MKMVKNLSKVNIGCYNGFERREDLDFADDGNHFKGFSYKGMPITTLRSNGTTYLSVRVDYLKGSMFTYKDWMKTDEFRLCNIFNGVESFDMDELVANLEKIIAKVNEMNAAAENEVLDATSIEKAVAKEIGNAQAVVDGFKASFKWYDADSHTMSVLLKYMRSVEKDIKHYSEININDFSFKKKKEMLERLNEYGYVFISPKSFFLRELKASIGK